MPEYPDIFLDSPDFPEYPEKYLESPDLHLTAAKKFVIFRFDYSPPSSRHLDPFMNNIGELKPIGSVSRASSITTIVTGSVELYVHIPGMTKINTSPRKGL
jgi:hypothetical protein